MIPFSPPRIDEKIVEAVSDVLRSGWITTGPKTKEFEKKITEYTSCKKTLCVNSASAGLELALRWFGVKEGDEVIVPAYTYAASANVIVHCGATPVFVDSSSVDFNISVEEIRKAITPKTKVIIPVDIAGFPADYDEINSLVREDEVVKMFHHDSDNQKMLGRILVLSDSAHSFGAFYKGRRTGALTDISVFSFHAVKNLTTAEGGAICLNLPDLFDHDAVYNMLNLKSLHGQNKDALSKLKIGNWKYDIIEAGYKCNMTDIQAAIGLTGLETYDSEILARRKFIFDRYSELLSSNPALEIPLYRNSEKESSYHVYLLRLKIADENVRDQVIERIFSKQVAVNVHFIPLPMMSFYKKLSYNIDNYPVAYRNYSREISLPVYFDLSDDNIVEVANAVLSAVKDL